MDGEEISPTKLNSSDDYAESIFSSDTDLDAYQEKLQETSNDDNNGDASQSREQFVDSCVKQIKELDVLDNLFQKLHRVGLLNDFMNFMCNLESGELPMDNIVFILMMD